jgi:hypothetical protein
MDTNTSFFWRLLFLFSACLSFAQNINNPTAADLVGSDSGENSFRVMETPQGLRIIQRLSWFRDENDFRYEVVVEKQDEDGTYTQILREGRTENFIELSLAAGRYRYRVSVYNLLDQLEYATNWAVFSVGRARPPVLNRISPDHFALDGTGGSWVIELKGTNLLPESELSLRPIGEEAVIFPEAYTAFPDGNGGQVVFDSADLAGGRYELHIRNPGGFQATKGCTVKVKTRLPFDVFVSASYAPALPVYGYLSELFNDGIYPLGFSARVDVLPFRWDRASLGFEAFVFWNYLSVSKTGLEASTHFWGSNLNLLYQYNLFSRIILGLRLGAGQASATAFSYKINGTAQDPFSTSIFSLDGGISLKWLFHPNVFAELGLDYVNAFSVDGSQGFLLPFAGAGWKY